MNIRTEYTRYLSDGFRESKNAALGIALKYAEMAATPLTQYKLLDEVYSELIALYIQSEVGLMKAFAHKMGYPSIDQGTSERLTKEFTNIFLCARDHIVDREEDPDNFDLPNGQQTLVDYTDFQYIDDLNRKVEVEQDAVFEQLETLVSKSPHRMRFRELFIDKDM